MDYDISLLERAKFENSTIISLVKKYRNPPVKEGELHVLRYYVPLYCDKFKCIYCLHVFKFYLIK